MDGYLPYTPEEIDVMLEHAKQPGLVARYGTVQALSRLLATIEWYRARENRSDCVRPVDELFDASDIPEL
jgi:hypothetical protein